LKLYDNIIDWNLEVNDYFKEVIKFALIILPTVTFLIDLNSIYGTLFLHLFSYFDNPHGLDTIFFQVGMNLVILVSIVNFIYNKISLKNLFEMTLVGCVGYAEANLFEEEWSVLKIITRVLVMISLFTILTLHFSKYFVFFSRNVIQLMICGIGYLGVDLLMILYIILKTKTS